MTVKSFIPLLLIFAACTFTWAGLDDLSLEEIQDLYNKNTKRVIGDREFFGSFEQGRWVEDPMLDYGYAPQLQPVEEAAKEGDYAKAGAELLKYYQARPLDPKNKPGGHRTLRVDLWIDKIFGFDQQLKLLDIFPVSEQPSETEIRIENLSALQPQFTTFMLMGRHKNGIVARVASRESNTPPILEMEMQDGTTLHLTPNADTYTRAGKFSRENYGKQEALEICNSGLKVQKAYDDNTRRTFLSFDLKKVDTKNIRKAMLKIQTWADDAAQKVILFWVRPTVVDEMKMTWANDLGYIYSWEGLREGVDWNKPRGAHSQFPNWLLRLYWLHNMTGWAVDSDDPQAGRITLDLIGDFAADYPKNRFDNYLNVAGRGEYYSECLPHLFKVEACTPRDCVELLKAVVRDMHSLFLFRGGDGKNASMSVLYAMHQGCFSFPELAASKAWLAEAQKRLEGLLKTLVMKDGAYVEHTFGYPFGVLNQFLNLLQLYTANEIAPPAKLAEKAHRLARYLMFCSLPDAEMPKWGEGNGKNTRLSPPIRRAAELFNDPELTWWITVGQFGYEPKHSDVSYPEAKIAVLRSDWSPEANYLFFAPRAGGGHYHVDQNMVVLYAYGQPLLNDTGMSSYESRHPHFDWQRHQTKSHNTVEVDEKGFPRFKQGVTASEEVPCASAVYDSERAAFLDGWADGYPQVRHRRSIFHHKYAGFYVVYDLLTPKDGKSHTYDLNWHIHPFNKFETDGETCEVWTTNEATANLYIKSLYPEKPELLVREGFNAVPLTEKTYPAFRQVNEGDAEFVTLLNPVVAGENPRKILAELLSAPDGAKALAVETNHGRGIMIFSPAGVMIKVEAVTTDARFAYVQFDKGGKVSWSVQTGGSFVRVDGKDISAEELRELSPPGLPAKADMEAYQDRRAAYQTVLDVGNKALKEDREFRLAADKFQEAAVLADTDEEKALVHYNTGLSWMYAGEIEKAVEAYRKSAQYPESHLCTLSLRLMGRMYMSLGEKEKAREAFEAFLARSDAPPVFRKSVQEELEKIKASQ